MKKLEVWIIVILLILAGLAGYFWFLSYDQELNPQPRTDIAVKRSVKLYYYNPIKDQDETGNIMCSRNGLEAVDREIPVSETPIQDTVRLLLKGELTQAEKDRGLSTEFPLPGVDLAGASLNNGILTLEFRDPQNRTGGGSCRVAILWAQIEATAAQFQEVSEVRFIPEELFQP